MSMTSRSECTNPTSTRSEFVCSIANATFAARATVEDRRERGFERVGRVLPGERRRGPGREHEAAGTEPGGRVDRPEQPRPLRLPLFRFREVERPEADEVADASPRATASSMRATPSSQPCASSFATDTPTWSMPCRSQNARSSASELR